LIASYRMPGTLATPDTGAGLHGSATWWTGGQSSKIDSREQAPLVFIRSQAFRDRATPATHGHQPEAVRALNWCIISYVAGIWLRSKWVVGKARGGRIS